MNSYLAFGFAGQHGGGVGVGPSRPPCTTFLRAGAMNREIGVMIVVQVEPQWMSIRYTLFPHTIYYIRLQPQI